MTVINIFYVYQYETKDGLLTVKKQSFVNTDHSPTAFIQEER
jgi:hypothetical protein